ncbi:EamA family transporter [Candidatus Uhrbacteria bacterium]|nr:EamA family transporter [Candidatus Uhrbacteria bacterium]
MNKAVFPLILLLAVLLEVGGDILFKLWADADKRWFLIAGFVLYAVGSLFWAASLKYQALSKAGTVFMVVNFAATALIGVLVFREKLSWTNIAGISLGLLAIIMIEL